MKSITSLLVLILASSSALAGTTVVPVDSVIWKNPNTEYITCDARDYDSFPSNNASTLYCHYFPIGTQKERDRKRVTPAQYAKLLGWNKIYRIGLVSISHNPKLIIEVSK